MNSAFTRSATPDTEMDLTNPPPPFATPTTLSKREVPISSIRPRPIQVHNAGNMPPSALASPPTPAPSPIPLHRAPDWSTAAEHEDFNARSIRALFVDLQVEEQQRLLAKLLSLCNSQQLSFVQKFVSPRLKKDPFVYFPDEICLRILTYLDDVKALARSSQVSKRWRELVWDDAAWKALCEKHLYLKPNTDIIRKAKQLATQDIQTPGSSPYKSSFSHLRSESASSHDLRTRGVDRFKSNHTPKKHPPLSYRSYFKQRYMVDTAWRHGGKMHNCHITPDHGVVTSLHLTDKYIVVALDNAKIHVFSTEGDHQKTLQGHVMGVWAMVPWGDTLISGGCDRDVRVWNMETGASVHTLRGHTSTVRCLKMADSKTAISGSRDTTLRVWDIEKGICKHVLVGHGASVRCLELHGDLVVSGSYDTFAKIWSISQGKCLRTLSGHFSQIYAIAFDGQKIATGSLDTMVRIWDIEGKCLAVLQGHTSLVGQIQMRDDKLVTGGSDGSVRVWSLIEYQPIHRLAAHDNSVTSLQFDDNRIVSGGSDGRVKVWDLKTGAHVRELCAPAENVWRVVFEDEKAVIMANRAGKTVMEVWSFSPPEEEFMDEMYRSESPASMLDHAMGDYQESSSMPNLIAATEEHSEDIKDVMMTDSIPVDEDKGSKRYKRERNSK